MAVRRPGESRREGGTRDGVGGGGGKGGWLAFAHLAKIAAPDEETLRYFPLPCTDLMLTDCP